MATTVKRDRQKQKSQNAINEPNRRNQKDGDKSLAVCYTTGSKVLAEVK